jgi:hypothetical protein
MSSSYNVGNLHNQNDLLMKNLMNFYKDQENLEKMVAIINGESRISLRIIDWFVTNFAKKYYIVYENKGSRFKVYNEYKLKLKGYNKVRFDPFSRWERITIPFGDGKFMETTIGQLNFFKWAIENNVIEYIEKNYDGIEEDMNSRNSTSKNRFIDKHNEKHSENPDKIDNTKTRKKREELSVSACKCIKKEDVKIIVKFN